MTWNALYLVDTISVCIFLLSYYGNCYRKGYRIDFWHAHVFLYCVLPNMVMLPFASSPLNAMIVGQDFAGIVAALPTIFLITTIGYLSMLVGGSLWTLQAGVGLRRVTKRALRIGPHYSMLLMSSRNLLVFQTTLCVALQAVMLMIYFTQSGFGFDLRAFTFANPSLRPIALIISNYSVIIGSHCLARYIDKKEKVLPACTLLLTVGLVFFGSRSNLSAIYLSIFLCYLVQRRSRISLLKLAGIVLSLLAFAFYLGSLRAGEYSLAEFARSFVVLTFYGNNFSDLRDFAWVYADWNHAFWFGKTYLAGVTAFVPRFASEFRDTWGLGVATGTTIGLDPHEHPGVRPGSFGEGFLNFGWIGASIVGLLLGVIIRLVDTDVKAALQSPSPSMMRAFASTMLLGVASCVAISANLSNLYVLLGVYFFSWLCLRFGALVRSSSARPQLWRAET